MILLEADDGSRCRRIGATKHLHELLRLELVWQLTETLAVAGTALPDNKLLVLVGKIVESHLAKEELLAFVL